MFFYILFFKLLTLKVSIADPGPTLVDSESYKPAQSSYNYYGYRQGQLQTPSPYLNKRHPDSNTYSNSEQSSSSIASSYGNLPTKTTANQCKLHITCPSKIIKKFCLKINIMMFRCKKSSFIRYSRTSWYRFRRKKNTSFNNKNFFRTTRPIWKTRSSRSKWSTWFTRSTRYRKKPKSSFLIFRFISFKGRDGYTNIKSAFFAALNNTYSLQTDSSIVIWDDILLNKNNHLNNQTGVYYAPINGLYEFSLTVCVPANHIVCSKKKKIFFV